MTDASDPSADSAERDVVVVGGGPAGSSAGVFTARYGLDTVVFDRGSSSLRRCAYLENYLGFPGGIDVDAFVDLMHDHAETAGCDVVPEMVESVDRNGDDSAFVVETREGRRVAATRVVAAARYDAEYLRPLGGDAMYEMHEHHGEVEERFDPDYPDADGRTPIDGLYVAAPNGERNEQAIISAGHGARVARSLLEDHRADLGYPEGVARHYDWLRPKSEFSGEWADRDRWREWFDNQVADDPRTSDERLAELREAYIDDAFESAVSEDEVERRTERGYDRLLDHLDDERIRAYLDRKDGRDGED